MPLCFYETRSLLLYKFFNNFVCSSYFLLVTILFFLFFGCFTSYAAEGIHETINFQSKIVNSDGTNFSGACGDSCNFRFSLWDSGSIGTELWFETYTGLSIQNGLIHVKLGSQNPFDSTIFKDDSLYLEVAIDADGLDGDFEEVFNSPRLRFSAVAYAFNSKYIEGRGVNDFVQLSPDGAQVVSGSDLSLIHIDSVGLNEPNFVQLKREGSDVFVIDHNGNVSIQPTSSSTALQVQGSTELSGSLKIGGDVDFQNNQAQNFRLENLGSSPICNISSLGRQYYNTSTTKAYICVESGVGVYTWVDFTNSSMSSLPTPLAGLQARRITDFALAALNTWYDIVLDTTDVESQPNVIEHNITNTERIDIKEDGLYQISYHLTANDAGVTHQIESRVQVNGTTVLHGSYLVNRNYQGEYGPTSTTFIANLSKDDYITLQAQRTTANTIINETLLLVIKLDGGGGGSATQDLDGVYAQDSDKTLIIDNSAGLTFQSVSSGDIVFDLRSTGGFALQSNSSDILRMTSEGSISISSDIDLSNNQLLRFRIENLDSAPVCSDLSLGRQYYNTITAKAYLCIESDVGIYTWIDFTSLDSSPVLSSLAVVQTRRTTNFTLAALNTWYNIDLDTTDIESVQAVLAHNASNLDRIDIKQNGLYKITYHITANDTGATHQFESRVRINDTSVINGSNLVNRNYQNEYVPTTASFVAELEEGDFITLQAMRATANTVIGETLFTIIKLDGYVLDASSFDLDLAYQNDTDKILNVDDSGGLTFNSTSTGDIAFNLQSTGGFSLQDNTSTALRVSNTGDFEYTLNSTDNPSFTINNLGTGMIRFNDEVADTSPVVIDSNGNVGIGTDAPATNLHVEGSARITDLVSCDIVYTDADGNLQCGQNSGATFETFNSSSQVLNNNTQFVVNIDSVRQSNSNYSLSVNEITIDSAGLYEVSFSCSSQASNTALHNRYCGIHIDTGSGYSQAAGALCYNYFDRAQIDSCSKTVVLNLNEDYKLRMIAQKSGGANHTILADGTSILVKKLISSGADLAEIYYTNEDDLESGDVVSVDSLIYAGVAKTQIAYDSKVLGIISTQPAKVIGNENISTNARPVIVALAGRVPVKVAQDSPSIQAGDYITSKEGGLAQKALMPGYVVGKALEDWNPESGKQTVLVFVDLGYFDPNDGKVYKDLLPTEKLEDVGINIGNIDSLFEGVYAENVFAKDKVSVSSKNLAEVYKSFDKDIVAGDIVGFDYQNDLSIKKNTSAYDKNLIGVVTADAGFALSDWFSSSIDDEYVYRPVALAGRTPVKVTTENGDIYKGDRLVASSMPGFAMKACGVKSCNSSVSIGIALEDFVYNSIGDSQEVEKILDEQTKQVVEQIDHIKDELENDASLYDSQTISSKVDEIQKVENEILNLVQVEEFQVGKGRVMMFVNLVYFQGSELNSEDSKVEPPSTLFLHESVDSSHLQGSIFGSIEVESLVVKGDARILGNIVIEGNMILSSQNVGRVFIEKDQREIDILFKNNFSNVPIVTITGIEHNQPYILTNLSNSGFTIRLFEKAESNLWFNWHAFESNFDDFEYSSLEDDQFENVSKTDINLNDEDDSSRNLKNIPNNIYEIPLDEQNEEYFNIENNTEGALELFGEDMLEAEEELDSDLSQSEELDVSLKDYQDLGNEVILQDE
jgi:hypothetical protein